MSGAFISVDWWWSSKKILYVLGELELPYLTYLGTQQINTYARVAEWSKTKVLQSNAICLNIFFSCGGREREGEPPGNAPYTTITFMCNDGDKVWRLK